MLTLLRLLALLGLWETASDEETEQEEGQEEESAEDDEVRDPAAKIRSLEDHVARLHRRLEERDTRIKELEDAVPEDHGPIRVEAAFWRELVIGERRIGDYESAWDLFTARGFSDLVKAADDSDVTEMDTALGKLVDRYPWLADEPLTTDDDDAPPRRPTASRPRRKRGGTPVLRQAAPGPVPGAQEAPVEGCERHVSDCEYPRANSSEIVDGRVIFP